MKLRHLLLGTACALGSIGAAQAATGWYFSMGAGANWLQDADYAGDDTDDGTFFGTTEFERGFVAAAAVGYDFGKWRVEFEVAHRQNDVDCVTFSGDGTCYNSYTGDVWELSQMVNVLYDIPLGGRFSAYVGAGVGGVLVSAERAAVGGYSSVSVDLDDYVVAGQLIAGMNYDLSDRWQLFADYRYFLADDPEFSFADSDPDLVTASIEKSDHTVMIGLRFDLQRDGAAPPRAAEPPTPGRAPKQFIVFFGFNKSNLTPEAARVVADAAAAAKEYGSASIMVVGHTDSSGSSAYNQSLSMRRSQAVKDGLAANGVPGSMVSTGGRGEAELMVQTGDGVKEPQNRRATIDLN
ncbi:MAG: OmpA family protein [Micropepsaceae bacterium]